MDSNENMAEVSSVLCYGSSQAIEHSNTDSSKTNKRKRSEIWNHYCEERSREDLARMDGLKVVEGAIHRIRKVVKYIKSSQGRLELFMGIVKQFKTNGKKRICIDVPTRWNSIYLMLNDAIEFKDVFMRLVARDPNFDNAPTEEDWSQGIIICNFLKVFHLITEVFSQTKNPTANLYFYEIWRINMLLIEESRSSNAVVMMMALKMQEKIDKYWKECSHILAVGVVLDPRHKMNLIIYCFQTIHGNGDRASFEINKVREVLQTFYDNYAILYGTNVSLVQVDERVSTSQGGRDENRFMHGYKEFIHGVQVTQPSKSELETYLEEKVHPLEDQNFDILQYWKFNESKYPILSRMVRDILTIPISTVASESAFSTAGRILDDFRSSLSPNTVEIFHFLIQNTRLKITKLLLILIPMISLCCCGRMDEENCGSLYMFLVIAKLDDNARLLDFTEKLEAACIGTVESGKMTKDLALLNHGPKVTRDQWLNTEEFIDAVAEELRARLLGK
ncbi:zinc finger BED domain-containing protein RICESLEEPER 2-like [Phoenix dactylifera]|uniref:Zinc finger BED domain-containing protein RICESLEEPER 2-like n=1 Tax=Phoenix dactylifera TaxID=42345 RepID=A0A8B8ZKJ7_PHODC|nr:zinc finger BED domain-containing protein RICESLEEPER 2-like [Phoenix dactylifera]